VPSVIDWVSGRGAAPAETVAAPARAPLVAGGAELAPSVPGTPGSTPTPRAAARSADRISTALGKRSLRSIAIARSSAVATSTGTKGFARSARTSGSGWRDIWASARVSASAGILPVSMV
jgi:hypothetical protein